MTQHSRSGKRGATFVRLYPSDWRSGCIGLTLEQEGLLSRICNHYYETGRRLPLDDHAAAHRIGLNPKNYRRVRDELLEHDLIRRHHDGYGNDRAEYELAAAIQARSPQAEVRPADMDAAWGPPDQERSDGRDQSQGRPRSEPVSQEMTGHQSAVNSGSIADQSGVLVEKVKQNQRPFIEPVLDTREKKESPLPPKGDPRPSPILQTEPVTNWSSAFATDTDHAGIVVTETGGIQLVNGTRQFWLAEFGEDARRLDLALRQITVQPASRTPVRAQVERQLARMAADKHDRDQRYQAAVRSNKPDKPARVSRW